MTRLSVGIPAHNEEHNIRRLIESVLAQRTDGFELLEVLVVSDGSTDRTCDEVRLVASRDVRVRLVEEPVRAGQPTRQNQILRAFKGDALVLLNADVAISQPDLLSRMVVAAGDGSVGIVSPSTRPLSAEGLFERVINYSVSLKRSMYESIPGNDNIYLCHGRARLFSRKLADSLTFPDAVGEDAFSHMACKSLGLSFVYLPDAQVLYRSPQSLADHLKQSKRFIKGMHDHARQPGRASYYAIPAGVVVRVLVSYFLRNPVYFLCYLSILFYSRFQAQFYQASTLWEEAATSKKL